MPSADGLMAHRYVADAHGVTKPRSKVLPPIFEFEAQVTKLLC